MLIEIVKYSLQIKNSTLAMPLGTWSRFETVVVV